VLAYGYDLTSGGDLAIYVYDPNVPDSSAPKLTLNIGDPYHTTPVGYDFSDHAIIGFFRTDYQRELPPAGVEPHPNLYWSSAGPISGRYCTQIVESADPHTWNDNYLCADADYGIRWSSAGPISGMRCTQISEPSDPDTWNDNYLCVPSNSPLKLGWSYAGPLASRFCVQWFEAADPHTWSDNYLCAAYSAPALSDLETFNAQYYLAMYSDLRSAFGTDTTAARDHWLRYGSAEGRSASPAFDVGYYLGHYSDLKGAFGSDMRAAESHYLNYGLHEGRAGSDIFDVRYYLAQYGDLRSAYGADYTAPITASRNVQSRNLSYWAVKSLVPTRYDRMSHCLQMDISCNTGRPRSVPTTPRRRSTGSSMESTRGDGDRPPSIRDTISRPIPTSPRRTAPPTTWGL
jgi:hypothetical protein